MEMLSVNSLLIISSIWILGRHGLAQLLDEGCRPIQLPMIRNGTDSERAPYMAFITRNGEHLCGGSLIADRSVLTAKHCFIHAGNYSVKLGVHNTQNPEKEQTFEIAERITHLDPYIDLMLLKLDRVVKYEDHIRPICILLGPEQELLNSTNDLTITGWGQISNENATQRPWILQTAELKRIHWDDCGRPHGYICAEAAYQFACQGDSGGPLAAYVKHNQETVNAQVGVLHGGLTDRCDSFSQYVDVVNFTNWIVDMIRLNKKI